MAEVAHSRKSNVIDASDTTDSELLTQIGADDYLVGTAKRCMVRVNLSGGSVIAFDQFAVKTTLFPAGDEVVLFNPDGTPVGLYLHGDDLTALAHGSSGFLLMDCEGLYSLSFWSAQAGVTAVAVTRALQIIFLGPGFEAAVA